MAVCDCHSINVSATLKTKYVQCACAYVQSSLNALHQVFKTLKISANVFHNGQYCGSWAVDTSGSGSTSFHLVTHGNCIAEVADETFEMQAGDAIFLPSDTQHVMRDQVGSQAPINAKTSLSMSAPFQSDGTGLVCGFLVNKHPLGARLLSALPDVLMVRANQHTSCATLISLLLHEAKNSSESESFLLDHFADALFFLLIRDHASASSGLLAAILHPQLSRAIDTDC